MFRQIFSRSVVGATLLALAAHSMAVQTWTVNFKDSDIQEVIKFVADVTGKTVIIDPRVKGRVKVISAKPLSQPELIHLFRSVLEVHDFSMVEVEDVIRIIPLKDTRSSPIPVLEKGNKGEGYVTEVLQLQNVSAARVLPSIRPLVPQHSHLSAYDPSNAIIITDSAENIERMRSLIELLDQSATPITEVIELKFANATEMVQTLNNLDKTDKQNAPANAINIIADKRNNAILVTGEDLQRLRVKSLIKRLDKPKSQTGNVRVVYLEYADAKTAAETLTKIVQNLSKLGPGEGDAAPSAATVEADEDTNALLITATGDELQTLLDVVQRLDIRRAQVLVEAIIVEMSDGNTENLGVEWIYRNTDNGTFASSAAGGGLGSVGASAFGAFANPDDETALTTFAGGLAGTPGQVLGVLGTNTNGDDFLAVLNALQNDAKSNILSTPTILTMDNHEANFSVGQNIPLLTGSSTSSNGLNSPFQTIQREDIGIKLTVTPQVNEGDKVLLEISQEVSSLAPASSGATDIITNQRKIETKVLASDGEVIVLGGLIDDQNRLSEQRIPILGSIPILGALFRSSRDAKDRTNLMVFLKASVIRDDATLAGATAEKYQYIREEQIRMQGNGFLRMKNKSLPVLPDLEYYNLSLPTDEPVKPNDAGAESGK